ncbi:MAG: hypothetical protein ISP90_09450 [Nevskia sp.]|nr:hypothetical protein [Nevskia sp.]
MTGKPSFFAELQRRHVYKVGAAYAVAGWLLVQVVTQVLPVFDVSAVGQRVLVLIVAAGFPVALVLAWVFDLTPQGIVRTESLPASGEPPAAARERRGIDRRLNYLLGALLLLSLGFLAAEHLMPPRGTAAAERAAAAEAEKSIAVLPFANLSDDKSNAYFAEGMQDEILTRLAKIGTLRVISRTSTQRYASSPDNIGEIAVQLGVSNILEGSVQKAGNRVRVNVQLIRAAGDSHLWAETYDRSLDDIFGVQGEVAGAIADALGARLSGGERDELARVPTRNPAAYDAYLRGLALYQRGFETASFVESTQAFEAAVAADPGFAQAWALLARGEALMIFFGVDTSAAQHSRTLQALQTAERLRPDLLETQKARAYYVYRVERNYAEALQRYEALHQSWPNDAEVLSVLSYILSRMDRVAEADRRAAEALQLDPRNLQLLKLQALQALAERRIGDAFKALERVQELAPGESESLQLKAILYQMLGDLPKAAALLDPAAMPDSDFERFVAQARLERRYDPLMAKLQAIADRGGTGYQAQPAVDAHLCVADFERLAGRVDAAKADYGRARAALQAMLAQQPDNAELTLSMAQAQAGLGNQAAALALVDGVAAEVPESKDAQFGRDILDQRARLLARFGRRDEAIAGLRHLITAPYTGGAYSGPLTPALLRLDPDFDALRDDPRLAQVAAEGEAYLRRQAGP